MPSLEQQLSALVTQIEQLRDAIPVDPAATAVTLEKHRSSNGSTCNRLRVPKGKALANGKRTMSLDAKDAADWKQKIYARNQQAKMAQCLSLIQQAAAVAASITWDFGEDVQLVNKIDTFTTGQAESGARKGKTAKPPRFRYVFKNAKGASPINRTVHAISGARPVSERWYSPALCGERPKAGSWGWDTAPDNELSCPKCAAKLKALGVGP